MKAGLVLSLALIVGIGSSTPAHALGKRMSAADKKEAEESPWTAWYNQNSLGAQLTLKRVRDELLSKNLHEPVVAWESYGKNVSCGPKEERFRTADGTCNNLSLPLVGSAGVAFGRNVPPEFIDQDGAKPEKLMHPNPAEVSKVLFTRDQIKEVPWLNMLAASWIQFMNHDWLTHGKNVPYEPGKTATEPFKVDGSTSSDVEKTKSPADLSKFKPEFGGKVTLNDTTHWWDGSQIYGSNQAEQDALRAHGYTVDADGKSHTVNGLEIGTMKTVMVGSRELLPIDEKFNPADNRQNKGPELTGFRDNWWVGLSMLHNLFVREHNAISKEIRQNHITYNLATDVYTWTNDKEVLTLDAKGADEQVFQTARLVNTAIMAKIHTVEWTPAILDNTILRRSLYTNWYGLLNPQTMGRILKRLGFNKTDYFGHIDLGWVLGGIVGSKGDDLGKPFSITEEFTSVYRLHSLIPDELVIQKQGEPSSKRTIDFDESRSGKAHDLMVNNDLKDLFYSFGNQKPGQLVLNNFPKKLQNLTVAGLDKPMDLAMVDIIRDRERGVPRYNQFRRAINLKPITKYEDFFPGGEAKTDEQKEILKKLKAIYDVNGQQNVESIDLLVGTSAEMVRPTGFGFGETMFQIFILMASRRLMTDRFFTDSYDAAHYTQTGLDYIDDKGWFHDVIGRHMPELKPHMKGLKSAFFTWKASE